MRALGSERNAVKAADVQASRRADGIDLELMAGAGPADEDAVVEFHDFVRLRGDEVAVELGVVVLARIERIGARGGSRAIHANQFCSYTGVDRHSPAARALRGGLERNADRANAADRQLSCARAV